MKNPTTDQAEQLEQFRNYLHLLARLQLGSRGQAKADASDIVQQTMVQAVRGLEGFRGKTEAEMAGWLRQILARQLANLVRDQGRRKCDVSREQSLEAALDASASQVTAFLAGDDSSPSEKAVRNEDVLRLTQALTDLPEAQREAVVLHHLEHLSLAEVGRQLDRSTSAVAGLIKRGLRQLRVRLEAST
jgi:RNA polymerase sigma-70 factor (ECF subfamily)